MGYEYMGERSDLLGLWEFIRLYMQGGDAEVEHLCGEVGFYLPIHDRKEGFVFGVVRTFAGLVHWPWLHLFFCLPFSFIALGRCVAMSTCRIPVWPKAVEIEGVVTEDDHLRRDWRDNPTFGFLERTWPLTCTALGVVAGFYIIYLIERSL
ncbi:hypothetical protein ACODUL_01160 [Stenotrophomonas maltophilia]